MSIDMWYSIDIQPRKIRTEPAKDEDLHGMKPVSIAMKTWRNSFSKPIGWNGVPNFETTTC